MPVWELGDIFCWLRPNISFHFSRFDSQYILGQLRFAMRVFFSFCSIRVHHLILEFVCSVLPARISSLLLFCTYTKSDKCSLISLVNEKIFDPTDEKMDHVAQAPSSREREKCGGRGRRRTPKKININVIYRSAKITKATADGSKLAHAGSERGEIDYRA